MNNAIYLRPLTVDEVKASSVFLYVHHGNTAAVSIFKKFGFATFSETDGFMKMELAKHEFNCN